MREHPSLLLAVKAALAAMLAWSLIQPIGGLAAEYPYYAPLGALAVVSTSVVVSVRSSVEVVVAILLGAAVALAVRLLPVSEPLPLGLAVVAASLLAAWGLAGAMGSWVPLAAMFVLVAGRGDPIEYSAAYGGLAAFGALVGVAVNAALPQLLLTRPRSPRIASESSSPAGSTSSPRRSRRRSSTSGTGASCVAPWRAPRTGPRT